MFDSEKYVRYDLDDYGFSMINIDNYHYMINKINQLILSFLKEQKHIIFIKVTIDIDHVGYKSSEYIDPQAYEHSLDFLYEYMLHFNTIKLNSLRIYYII